MDIANVTPKEKSVEIIHPATKEKIGLRIWVRSPYHESVKAAQRQNLDKRLSSEEQNMSADTITENSMNVIVAATSRWEWYGEDACFHGEKPDCTDDMKRKLYTEAEWIRLQVRKEFDDGDSFFAE